MPKERQGTPEAVHELQSDDVLQRAVVDLRTCVGSDEAVAALATRLAPRLAGTRLKPTHAARAATRAARKLILIRGGGAVFCLGLGLAAWQWLQPAVDRPPTRSPAPAFATSQPIRHAVDEGLAQAPPAVQSPRAPTSDMPQQRPERSPRPRVALRKPAPRVHRPDPEAELTLLLQAQAALERTPRAALAFTETHARSYPQGAFAEEREVIAVEAELQLGRAAQAIRRAQRFLRRFPGSAHAARMATISGESAATGPTQQSPPATATNKLSHQIR